MGLLYWISNKRESPGFGLWCIILITQCIYKGFTKITKLDQPTFRNICKKQYVLCIISNLSGNLFVAFTFSFVAGCCVKESRKDLQINKNYVYNMIYILTMKCGIIIIIYNDLFFGARSNNCRELFLFSTCI